MAFLLLLMAITATVRAQSVVSICASYASTVTVTSFQTHFQTCPCESSSKIFSTWTTSTSVTTPDVVLPSATIVPETTTMSTISLQSSVDVSTTQGPNNSVASETRKPSSLSTSSIADDSDSVTTSAESSMSADTIESTSTSDAATSTTLITTIATTTSDTNKPIVTDQAYIDTVVRHHNIHRQNHTVDALTWSPSLADTARTIAESCVYEHNIDVPNPDYDRYGQNIGAGYLPIQMGLFITEGLYNSEVNSYTYFGGEPNLNTTEEWGHFSQLVWKGSQAVGCWTQDCTESGLQNVGDRVAPYFVVCNYGPVGNVIGQFAQNVLRDTGLASVHADYNCPNQYNCVDD